MSVISPDMITLLPPNIVIIIYFIFYLFYPLKSIDFCVGERKMLDYKAII